MSLIMNKIELETYVADWLGEYSPGDPMLTPAKEAKLITSSLRDDNLIDWREKPNVHREVKQIIINLKKKGLETMSRPKGLPKTGGRKKGQPNRSTGDLKEWIMKLIDSSLEQLELDMQSLEPMQRLQIAEKLMQYVIAKKSSVVAKVDIKDLSEDDINELISKL